MKPISTTSKRPRIRSSIKAVCRSGAAVQPDQESDYAPAIEAGIKQKREEVEKIANNPAKPNFKNTFVALERAGSLLTRVMNVFGAMTSANTSDALQKLDEETSPKLAALNDDIMLNGKLFARIKAIYQDRDALKLDPESRRLVEVTYKNFELAGANLSDADKAKLKALNEEAATLSAVHQQTAGGEQKRRAGDNRPGEAGRPVGRRSWLRRPVRPPNASWRNSGCWCCKTPRNSRCCRA